MLELNQQNFRGELSGSELVLVDFWAPWCGPCKMIAPIVAEIAAEYAGRIKVGKVNVDDNQELAGQLNIMSIPTLCLFKQGQLLAQIVGFRPKKELKAELEKHLASN